MPRKTLVSLFLVLAAASVAQGQDVRLLQIRDDAIRSVVTDQLQGARSRGFTAQQSEPLVAKALEGVAMKAPPKEIKRAMDALEKRMRRASELLGPGSTIDEIAAGADALSVNAPEGVLKDIRKLAPKRTVTVELGVLTELIANKVAPKRAAQMVKDLMARGATGAQLTELNSAVQQDVVAGIKPDAALQLRGRGVMSLLPPPPSVNTAQKR